MVSEDTAEPEKCPQEVEQAFQHAEAEMPQQLKSIVLETRRKTSLSYSELYILKRYLATEGLLLQQLDKSLGLVLIKKDWNIDMLQDMLNNNPILEEITLDNATEELKRLNCLLGTKPIGNTPPTQSKFLPDASAMM
jgi:hypothetical protein